MTRRGQEGEKGQREGERSIAAGVVVSKEEDDEEEDAEDDEATRVGIRRSQREKDAGKSGDGERGRLRRPEKGAEKRAGEARQGEGKPG